MPLSPTISHYQHNSTSIVISHSEPVNSPHKWPVTRKMFPFDDVIMITGQPTMWSNSHLFHSCVLPYANACYIATCYKATQWTAYTSPTRYLSHIPQCTFPISHNAPFLKQKSAQLCANMLQNGALFTWCIVGFAKWEYSILWLCLYKAIVQ